MQEYVIPLFIVAYLWGALSINERVIYKKLTVAEQMGETK